MLRRFASPGSDAIDIGAWIGPTTLYVAHFARCVHAIEPDPAAGAELATNIAANPRLAGRVQTHACCIAPAAGPIGLYAGGMSFSEESRFGDSMSGLVPAEGTADQPRQVVEGIRLEDLLARPDVARPSLIKMDVEGGEYQLIPGRWRRLTEHGMPTLYVSFHAPPPAWREEKVGACLEELRACYRLLYAAADSPFDAAAALASVRDWGDEALGSDWRRLEARLGAGLVASNQPW